MSNATAIDFGSCWGTPNGQDLSSPSYMASGNLVVAEAILRRWTTGQGELIDDPNYGRNLLDLLSRPLKPGEIAYEQQQAAAEAKKDERVKSAQVTLNLSIAGVLMIEATIVTLRGAFRLVASVSAVSVQLLLVSP